MVHGEHVWNDQGGLIHFTHHDPPPAHEGGAATPRPALIFDARSAAARKAFASGEHQVRQP